MVRYGQGSGNGCQPQRTRQILPWQTLSSDCCSVQFKAVQLQCLLILMSIELMFLGINLNFIIFSIFLDDMTGQIFAIYVLTVAAAESAIGLAILVIYYKLRNSVTVESLQILKD